MSARLISSRTSLLRVNRPRQQNARLLELLYLACALLLGALLAATTLAAAPVRRDNAHCSNEHLRHPQTMSPVVRIAPRVVAAAVEPDSKQESARQNLLEKVFVKRSLKS